MEADQQKTAGVGHALLARFAGSAVGAEARLKGACPQENKGWGALLAS